MVVSFLVLTLNEEANLKRCLEAIAWSDDVVVLDSFSTDQTAEIAQKAGVRFFQRAFDHFAGQRNHALDTIPFKHPWVFHLDADEIVTPELRAEIERRLAESPANDTTGSIQAFRVPEKLMWGETWLKHSGCYPKYQVRLARRDGFRFVQVGHGQREVAAPETIGTLRSAYLHYSFSKGLADWLERHDRYSTAEARYHLATPPMAFSNLVLHDPMARRRWLRDLSFRVPGRPLWRFLYVYLWRLGFLDGRKGFQYACLQAFYEFLITLKMEEQTAPKP